MRLIGRHRGERRGKLPRIEISEAEISADLHYPAARLDVAEAFAAAGPETSRRAQASAR